VIAPPGTRATEEVGSAVESLVGHVNAAATSALVVGAGVGVDVLPGAGVDICVVDV
jgi:hypothetical protein